MYGDLWNILSKQGFQIQKKKNKLKKLKNYHKLNSKQPSNEYICVLYEFYVINYSLFWLQ